MPVIRTTTAMHPPTATRQSRASGNRFRLICNPPFESCRVLVRYDETPLEEVRGALEIKAIELAVAIRQLDADIVDEVPLDGGCHPPERAALAVPAVQIDVRVVQRGFNRARAAIEH